MRNGYRWMGSLFVALSLFGCQQTTVTKKGATPAIPPQTVAAEKPLPIPVHPWMWMSGARSEKDPRAYGAYGAEGVAAPGNTPPAVSFASAWTGPHGSLWLLGGQGRHLMTRAGLWKYTPATGLWTRVGGIPSPRYGAAVWARDGSVWVFGGGGVSPGGSTPVPPTLDSLWRYTPKSGWVRIGGPYVNAVQDAVLAHSVRGTRGVASPKNWPGSLRQAAAWTGLHGHFWLFGGEGEGNTRNSLWKYTPATHMWTWMGGPSWHWHECCGWSAKPAVYGTRGVPTPENWPGARDSAVAWVGLRGNLWLFGGSNDSVAKSDLWKYTPKTGLWTWMGGSRHSSQPGVRAALGVPAPTNWPRARYDAVGWTGPHGNLWLYGGGHISDTLEAFVDCHSVWKYTVTTGLWTWMGSGHRAGNEKTGFIGPRGVPTDEGPSGAAFSSAWTGLHGHFWVFGGHRNLNDLWRYTP